MEHKKYKKKMTHWCEKCRVRGNQQ